MIWQEGCSSHYTYQNIRATPLVLLLDPPYSRHSLTSVFENVHQDLPA